MGERGSISSRWSAVAGVALAVLLAPTEAAAHPAYVDAEAGPIESAECADINLPCDTIAEAIPFVEEGLQVIVDDSPAPYVESVTIGNNRALVTGNFAGGLEGGWTIDGGGGTAITVPTGQTASVAGFNLLGDASAVRIEGGGTVANNTFDDPEQSANGDVEVLGTGQATIVNNVFTDTDQVQPDTAIRVAGGAGAVTLSRNTIRGYGTGLDVGSPTGAVTLGSDLLTGNGTALEMGHDVTVTNATFWNNATDIASTDAHLTLDSSIVEAQVAIAGSATCDITFSRGPASNPCGAFQTSDDPMFVSPPADLHLQGGSPMIDAGNPAALGIFRDIDGDLRALDGDGDGACPVEPDMGADEFVGTQLDCTPPTPPPAPPAQPGDTTPPQTLIETGPAPKTKSASANFTFTSNEPGAAFECSLDGAGFAPCVSPHAVKVRKGAHEFKVRASDAAGNFDPSPASHSWTVKKKKKKKKKKK